MIEIARPYLLFLGDVEDEMYLKTAKGLRDWAPEACLGELSLTARTASLGLPKMTIAAAVAAGVRSLVIGASPMGGAIPDAWRPALIEAASAGLDIVAGLHQRLHEVAGLAEAARTAGARLVDVREPPPGIPVGTGRRRSGRRLLTVGTDCALGKKYTALALFEAFKARGLPCDLRATGQTGIMIAGGGVPMDAVVSDFEAGAAEMLSPDAAPDHWDIIEGQGSLFHPAYAAVSLGLLHGSQPDVIVVCHEAGRRTMAGLPDYATPTLEETIDLNLRMGGRTNPSIRCAGVALNTAHLDAEAADRTIAEESRRLGLPVADPIRGGPAFACLVEACLAAP